MTDDQDRFTCPSCEFTTADAEAMIDHRVAAHPPTDGPPQVEDQRDHQGVPIWRIAAAAAALALLVGGFLATRSGGNSTAATTTTTRMTTTTTTEPEPENLTGTLVLLDSSAFEEPGDPCNGTGGYRDIRSGARITVRDGDGSVLGASSMSIGTREDILRCRFEWEVPDIGHDADFYEVTIGNRAPVTYSHAELDGQGWHLALSLG